MAVEAWSDDGAPIDDRAALADPQCPDAYAELQLG